MSASFPVSPSKRLGSLGTKAACTKLLSITGLLFLVLSAHLQGWGQEESACKYKEVSWTGQLAVLGLPFQFTIFPLSLGEKGDPQF